MNFDSKYLIRWGVPGWVLIIGAFSNFIDFNKLNVNESSISAIVITLAGVPLGYIIHQSYYYVYWILINLVKIIKPLEDISEERNILRFMSDEFADSFKGDYRTLEVKFDRMLIRVKDNDKRNFIVKRYSYLLSTIHGLGSLLFSLHLVIALNFSYIFSLGLNEINISIVIVSIILSIPVLVNYHHYSVTKQEFMGRVMNDLYIDQQSNEEL